MQLIVLCFTDSNECYSTFEAFMFGAENIFAAAGVERGTVVGLLLFQMHHLT
jgi:hypothetical protein